MNIDDDPALMQRFNVRAVPTLLFFNGGKLREQLVGGAPKKTILEKLAILAAAPPDKIPRDQMEQSTKGTNHHE